MEFVRPQLVIFREQILHHQIGVQRRDAVHRKAAHHAHVGHANLFIMDHRQLRPHLLIARPGFLHQQFKSVVNLFDYLHVARQQRLDQLLIPALQRFRHQSMVGVGEGFAGDGPRIVPAHLVLIKQHAQQLRDGDGRVGVVQLDHFIIRQLMQLVASQMVATQNIGHRAGALEVLLHQAQFFPRQMVVIRIQHLGQFFGVDTLLLRAQEIAVVEFGQVERMGMFRLPQAQRLRDVIAIAKHRQIPGFAGNHESRLPFAAFADFTADAYLHIQRFVVAEPRIAAASPVIRRFHLLTVSEGLTEQTVLVVQAVTGRRLADGGHRIQEAGRQTAQAAVAQRRIGLFFQQVGQLDVVRLQRLAHSFIPAQVEQVITGQATDQELHRNVVNVALSFNGFRRRLRRQKLRQRAADRAPPLALGHLCG